jgi:hypothetical protein
VSLFYPRAVNEMRMLAKAVNQAKSGDPKALATQFEGMTAEGFDGGEITMRKDDHQVFQDMYISSFGPLDPAAKFDEEGTGWGWKNKGIVKASAVPHPHLCGMAFLMPWWDRIGWKSQCRRHPDGQERPRGSPAGQWARERRQNAHQNPPGRRVRGKSRYFCKYLSVVR